MKNKRIEMFYKYMEFESISLLYDLTKAKNIDSKAKELTENLRNSRKDTIFNLILFFLLLPIYSLLVTNFELSKQCIALFSFIVIMSYFFLIIYLFFNLSSRIRLLYLNRKRKKNKTLVLEYDKNKENLGKIISEFQSEGKDNLVLLYKDLVEKHKGKFNSDFETYEDPHEEFLSFYDLTNILFELKGEDFDREEIEDAFILYKAKKHNYLFDSYEINNIWEINTNKFKIGFESIHFKMLIYKLF